MNISDDAAEHRFFAGDSEMAARMRAFDWSTTSLGSAGQWPQSLRTAIRILLTTRHPMFIWWGEDLTQFYNDAYSQTMGPERHPSALGQKGRECWQEIWDIIGPQIETVMHGGKATWHEDQLVPVTRYGKREDVWWTYSFGPIDEETAPNGVGGVLVVCNDVTDRHRAFEAIQQSEERLRLALTAGVIGTWDWHIQTNRVFADERFAEVYGVDPAEAAAGAPIEMFLSSVHPDDQERLGQKIEAALQSQGDFADEYRLIQGDGSIRWVSARGHCHHDAGGKPSRFPGATIDITERKEAEYQRVLLSDELAHRGKNMLATMDAIVQQTLRSGATIEQARETLSARILAMSRAQDILTGRGVAGTDVRSVVNSAIEIHAGAIDRFHVNGPMIAVSARSGLSLALALHELATNAAKYGALSNNDGHVNIDWDVSSTETGVLFQLEWIERGGPAVSLPKRKGFGSRLIENVITAELTAKVSIEYNPAGVVCRFVVPFDHISAYAAPSR